MSTEEEQTQLEEHGYLLLESFMSRRLLASLRREVERIFEEEGDSAGSEFKQEPGCRRLANLVDKGHIFRQMMAVPEVLLRVSWVLGPRFKLSSLNARSADPGSPTQPLHADMAAVADEKGYWVCNTVWMLDDFTLSNGALRIVPGSHRWRQLPQNALEAPAEPHPEEVRIIGRAGTVVVLNAHLWHSGLANRTDRPRIAVHGFYCRRDKPQQQYQKRLLRPELQARLGTHLRDILALDDPENDRLSSQPPVTSGFMK